MTDCDCCFTPFSDSHKLFSCGCNFNCCNKCMKSFLLDSTKDPHCMNCSREIDRSTLIGWLGASWTNGTYKKYFDNILLERELAKLPSSQPAAKKVLDIKALDLEIKDLKSLLIEKTNQKFRLKYKTPIKRKQFIQHCCSNDCRGYLSTSWKCELCNSYSCSKCHTVKGTNINAPHECKPDDVASVQEINKSTINCPGCAAPTFKIKGCDQMFCTVPGCETAFSFKTGAKESGNIHNPHFFEMQRLGLIQGRNVRAPGDRICGGLPDISVLDCIRNQISSIPIDLHENPYSKPSHILLINPAYHNTSSPHYLYLYNYMFLGCHHINGFIDTLRTRLTRADDNEDIRVKFLLNKYTQKQFKSVVARRSKSKSVTRNILYVLELLATILLEQLRKITKGVTRATSHNVPTNFVGITKDMWLKDIRDSMDEIERIRDYCNKQFIKIATDYKIQIRFIPPNPAQMLNI